jgi:hypothetical protein
MPAVARRDMGGFSRSEFTKETNVCLYPYPRQDDFSMTSIVSGLIGAELAISVATGTWWSLLVGMLLILLSWWCLTWLKARHRLDRRDLTVLIDEAEELRQAQNDNLRKTKKLVQALKRFRRQLRKENAL